MTLIRPLSPVMARSMPLVSALILTSGLMPASAFLSSASARSRKPFVSGLITMN